MKIFKRGKLYAKAKHLACDKKLFVRREGRGDPQIAVERIFTVREGRAGRGQLLEAQPFNTLRLIK